MIKNRLHKSITLCIVLFMSLVCSAIAAPVSTVGEWKFKIGGQDTGTGSASVDSNGNITGAGHSDRFNVNIRLTGTVNANGNFNLMAKPAGITNSGTVFTGQATGETASGVWHNEEIGLNGTWTANRISKKEATKAGLHCIIGGEEFYVPEGGLLIADASIAESNHKDWFFRIGGGHGLGMGKNGNRTAILAKSYNTKGPGTYTMSNDTLWRTTVAFQGKKLHFDSGTINLTTYNPRGDGHAVGNMNFSASGVLGECSFNVYPQIIDIAKF